MKPLKMLKARSILTACLVGGVIGMIGFSGCSKPVETPTAITVTGPTTELEKMGAVKMASPSPVSSTPEVTPTTTATVQKVVVSTTKTPTKAGVKKHSKKVKTDKKIEENAAYRKAALNEITAVCLEKLVDLKTEGDIKAGEIREFGNVLQVVADNFPTQEEFADFCVQNGIVSTIAFTGPESPKAKRVKSSKKSHATKPAAKQKA